MIELASRPETHMPSQQREDIVVRVSNGTSAGGSQYDQAHGLRVLAAQRRGQEAPRKLGIGTRVIAVTSGKGGVGKTNVTVNLASLFARWGKRVMILDCDLGTANVDVMLGMHPRYSLQHVLSRQKRLEEVIVTAPNGVQVIPGGSGLQDLANLSDSRREELLATLGSLDGMTDVLLLDTGAGIASNVLQFVRAAGEAVIVTTPEPPAVTDAYALIKVASLQNQQGPLAGQVAPAAEAPLQLRLVINQVHTELEGRETADNIAAVAKRFLNVDVQPFGFIPADPNLRQAVRRQTPVVEAFPRTPAAAALERIGRQLLASGADGAAEPVPQVAQNQGVGGFMRRMLSFGRGKN